MKKLLFIFISFLSFLACDKKTNVESENNNTGITDSEYITSDIYNTSEGELKITLVGHASLIFEYGGKVIHVDPYSKVVDYNKLPKADLVIITHEHRDHLDTKALDIIKKEATHFIVSSICFDILSFGEKTSNAEDTSWNNISIKAVPAYNIVHKKPDGEAYHPKGKGNGYIFTFGDKKIYVAGDTENIPEMESLKGTIDIAFLPNNLPYTMNEEMFIDAAKKVEPKILYPYHMIQFDNPDQKIEFNQEEIGQKLKPVIIKLKEKTYTQIK